MTATTQSPTKQTIEDCTLTINEEIHVRASLEATFAALLEELSTYAQGGDGKLMSMKIEPWPGSRWYRDLGNQNGHLWGHVQAIKSPSLLEITGPLMMSNPVVSNVQYRLTEQNGETVIKFRHAAFGLIQEDHRQGLPNGWGRIHARVVERAEAGISK